MGCDSVGSLPSALSTVITEVLLVALLSIPLCGGRAQAGFPQIHKVAMVICVSYPDIKSKGRRKVPFPPFLCLG